MDEETRRRLINLVNNILDVLDQGNSDGGYGPKMHFLLSGEEGEKQLKEINELIYDFENPDYPY